MLRVLRLPTARPPPPRFSIPPLRTDRLLLALPLLRVRPERLFCVMTSSRAMSRAPTFVAIVEIEDLLKEKSLALGKEKVERERKEVSQTPESPQPKSTSPRSFNKMAYDWSVLKMNFLKGNFGTRVLPFLQHCHTPISIWVFSAVL